MPLEQVWQLHVYSGIVRGKLTHHGDARVFVGSSYRKLMDREIIRGKKKKGES